MKCALALTLVLTCTFIFTTIYGIINLLACNRKADVLSVRRDIFRKDTFIVEHAYNMKVHYCYVRAHTFFGDLSRKQINSLHFNALDPEKCCLGKRGSFMVALMMLTISALILVLRSILLCFACMNHDVPRVAPEIHTSVLDQFLQGLGITERNYHGIQNTQDNIQDIENNNENITAIRTISIDHDRNAIALGTSDKNNYQVIVLNPESSGVFDATAKK